MLMSQATLSLDALIPTLQLAIGPMILISGVGLLLLCMNNRIAARPGRCRVGARARRVSSTKQVSQGTACGAHHHFSRPPPTLLSIC